MKKTNKLINEKSPYLLQHAYNPVNWYPWCDEAFSKANIEKKPIFLSIGYSTCHWCHVMEKESFEDEEVAKILNEHFVSIKVDREERPDIDMIYMNFCMMLTGSGGWPLTIFTTPDKKPFYAGTYFPKENRYGRIGLKELLNKIVELWQNDPKSIIDSSENIFRLIKQSSTNQIIQESLKKESIRFAYDTLKNRYDKTNGGFGDKPKFPTPQNYLFLLRYYHQTNDQLALKMVEHTARKMRLGGIYDQIGYGFHRYSTDERWMVPHFEKMLYDQALMSILYTELYQTTKNEFYKKTAEEIFEYILREMTDVTGGFYSAEDADSEGDEGKFYLWEYGEVKNLLGDDANKFIDTFNISQEGNSHIDIFTNKNILYLNKSLSEISVERNIPETEFEKMRQLLFDYRNKRIHPFKDDKILTDWNGLMIAAFAIGYNVLGHNIYLETALNATNFILNRMIKPDGTLYHRFRDNEAKINANLDDYSFLIWGLLELYQACSNTKYLKIAMNFQDTQIQNFWDNVSGGFFFTDKNESSDLIQRPKVFHDSAIPSGNSVSLYNMLRLYHITGNETYSYYSQELIKACSAEVNQNPYYYLTILLAYMYLIYPTQEIVIVGNIDETKKFRNIIYNKYNPNRVILLKTEESILNDIAPFTAEMKKIQNKPTVYICENFTCKLPINSLEEIEKYL